MDNEEIMRKANKATRSARAENLSVLGYNAYKDKRCKEKNHFIVEKPDGSETLSAFDVITKTYTEIKKMTPVNA